MKRRLLGLLFFFLLCVALVFLLAQGDGYLLIAFGTKTIEMTLWVAALALVAVYGGYWLLKQVLASSLGLARRFREIFLFGSVERAQKRAASGMVDYLTGDWLEARKKLVRTFERIEFPLPNYIAAARSSFEMGDEEEAERLLELAKINPGSELPVALTRARLQVQAGRHEKALTIIKPIQLQFPKQPAVLDLLHHIYLAQNNWRALQDLFPAMRKAKVLSAPELHELETRLAVEQLSDVGQQAQQKLVAERLPYLQQSWKNLTRTQQKNPVVVFAYAKALMNNYQDQEAEGLVRKTLSNHWYSPLVNLYGRLQLKEIRGQIRIAESWLKEHANDAALLLTLGRLMIRIEQWDQARDYFQRSLKAHKQLETIMELASLMEKLGDHKAGTEFYRQGLILVGHKE
jgi:HemY protein